MKLVTKITDYLSMHPNLRFFLKYTALFTMLTVSLVMLALHRVISSEANPFFYANF